MDKKIRKTFKYRLYPNKEQKEKLEWTLARCCEVYNACLQERRDRYNMAIKQHPNYYDMEWRRQATKEHAISLYSQQNQLYPMKQDRTEYKELSAAHILNDVCKRVDFAFQRFFDRAKQGKTPGYPRFQGKNRYDSFCYPDSSGWKVEGKILHLTRIGDIKIKLHRPIEGTIKTCTVRREGEHWYVTFSCEVEVTPLPVSYEDTGIDLGVSKLATFSNGEAVEHPRYLRKSEKKLEANQQVLSRKKRGSNRRKKAVKNVARIHRKITRQRKDYLHKESRKLVNRYQVIVFEDLQTANLTKRPKPKQDEETGQYLPNNASAKAGLNKSILDAGLALFVGFCAYKAEWAGRTLLKVNPYRTSQICSGCGCMVKKELSERVHNCPHCNLILDRDHNAAINILTLGMKQIEVQSNASHNNNEAGSASASVSVKSPKRKRQERAAESFTTSTPSQDTLWAGSG